MEKKRINKVEVVKVLTVFDVYVFLLWFAASSPVQIHIKEWSARETNWILYIWWKMKITTQWFVDWISDNNNNSKKSNWSDFSLPSSVDTALVLHLAVSIRCSCWVCVLVHSVMFILRCANCMEFVSFRFRWKRTRKQQTVARVEIEVVVGDRCKVTNGK